jgi:hypothetical protein
VTTADAARWWPRFAHGTPEAVQRHRDYHTRICAACRAGEAERRAARFVPLATTTEIHDGQ